jgi:hypothetical protein
MKRQQQRRRRLLALRLRLLLRRLLMQLWMHLLRMLTVLQGIMGAHPAGARAAGSSSNSIRHAAALPAHDH